MGFHSDQKNWTCGSDPAIFGAIFMANRSTKEECLRRKLFGLPLPQINFVKEVKCGMVLFLFEFEERKLFGVFQAISDGALNIVPHAYDRKFPAQIRVTPIWDCKPLYEREFHDSILDNYYTSNKFNFGLSWHQVLNLLCLFDLRKMKVQKSESPLIREKLLREECLSKSALGEKCLERSVTPDHYIIVSQSTPSDSDSGRSRHTFDSEPPNMDCHLVISASDVSNCSDKRTVETEGFMIGDNELYSFGEARNPQVSPYSKSSVAGFFSSSESEIVPFCLEAEKANPLPMKPVYDVSLDDTNGLGDFIPLDDEKESEPASKLSPQSINSRYENVSTSNLGVNEDMPHPKLSLSTLFSSKPANFGMENLSTPYSPSKHPPYVPSCEFPAKQEVEVEKERVSVFSRMNDSNMISSKGGVFSRLEDCKKISLKDEDDRVGMDYTDLSVDELMGKLSQYQKQWVKSSKKSEQEMEWSEVDDCADSFSECEDAEEQQHVEEILVNFKRRNRGMIERECRVEESDGMSNTVMRKRRKLRRPSFVVEETPSFVVEETREQVISADNHSPPLPVVEKYQLQGSSSMQLPAIRFPTRTPSRIRQPSKNMVF